MPRLQDPDYVDELLDEGYHVKNVNRSRRRRPLPKVTEHDDPRTEERAPRRPVRRYEEDS